MSKWSFGRPAHGSMCQVWAPPTPCVPAHHRDPEDGVFMIPRPGASSGRPGSGLWAPEAVSGCPCP